VLLVYGSTELTKTIDFLLVAIAVKLRNAIFVDSGQPITAGLLVNLPDKRVDVV
jgi:hypothetical protein